MSKPPSGRKSPGKTLPARPSLEFERKQAKTLLQAFATADPAAVARVRRQLPDRSTLSLRNAQFVIAREYGFDGWPQLKDAILNLTRNLEWAASQARQAIASNDVSTLR